MGPDGPIAEPLGDNHLEMRHVPDGCPLILDRGRCLARDPYLWDCIFEAIQDGQITAKDAAIFLFRVMGGRSWRWFERYFRTPRTSAARSAAKVYGAVRRECGTVGVMCVTEDIQPDGSRAGTAQV